MTPVLSFLTTVIIEVYSQCFTESVSLRDVGKSTSRAEISSPSSLYSMAVNGALSGSALLTQLLLTNYLRKQRHNEEQLFEQNECFDLFRLCPQLSGLMLFAPLRPTCHIFT